MLRYLSVLSLLVLACLSFALVHAQPNPSTLVAMTSAERDAIREPQNGMTLYNMTTHCINYYGDGMWRELCGKCATPPPMPEVEEVKAFYNAVTVKIKPDRYAHQLALLPTFTLIPDSSNKRVILRNENTPQFDKIMLLNVSDCGSSEMKLIDVTFSDQNPCKAEVVKDSRDGQEYRTYPLGNQCWMTQNLRFGEADNRQIFLNSDKQNKLYRWNFGEIVTNAQTKKNEVKNPKNTLCPAGWHIPTEQDLDELIQYYVEYGSAPLFRNVFKSDENAQLYNLVSNKTEFIGDMLLFWSSTPAPYDDTKYTLLIREKELLKHAATQDAALPLRCIQD